MADDFEPIKFDGKIACGSRDSSGVHEFEARIVHASLHPSNVSTNGVEYYVQGRKVTRVDFETLLKLAQERDTQCSLADNEQDDTEYAVIAARNAEIERAETQARHDEMINLMRKGLQR